MKHRDELEINCRLKNRANEKSFLLCITAPIRIQVIYRIRIGREGNPGGEGLLRARREIIRS